MDVRSGTATCADVRNELKTKLNARYGAAQAGEDGIWMFQLSEKLSSSQAGHRIRRATSVGQGNENVRCY